MVMVAALRYPKPGRGVPTCDAEADHGEVLTHHVDVAKGRRAPQHNHQPEADVATASLWLPRQDPDQSNNGQTLRHRHVGSQAAK